MKLSNNTKKYALRGLLTLVLVGVAVVALAQSGSTLTPFWESENTLYNKYGSLVVMDLPVDSSELAGLSNPIGSLPGVKLYVDNAISTFSELQNSGKMYVTGCDSTTDGRARFGSTNVDTSSCASVNGDLLATDFTDLGNTATNRYLCADANGVVALCAESGASYSWVVSSWGACSGGESTCTGTYSIPSESSCERIEYSQSACDSEGSVPELGAAVCAIETTSTDCAAVGSSGFFTHIGSCYRCVWEASTSSCSTLGSEASCEAYSTCTWNTDEFKTRTVTCVNQDNVTVSNSLCIAYAAPITGGLLPDLDENGVPDTETSDGCN